MYVYIYIYKCKVPVEMWCFTLLHNLCFRFPDHSRSISTWTPPPRCHALQGEARRGGRRGLRGGLGEGRGSGGHRLAPNLPAEPGSGRQRWRFWWLVLAEKWLQMALEKIVVGGSVWFYKMVLEVRKINMNWIDMRSVQSVVLRWCCHWKYIISRWRMCLQNIALQWILVPENLDWWFPPQFRILSYPLVI